MSKSVAQRFADATAKLEDLHGIAVEGQRSDNSPDMQIVLVGQIQSGLASLAASMSTLARAVNGTGE